MKKVCLEPFRLLETRKYVFDLSLDVKLAKIYEDHAIFTEDDKMAIIASEKIGGGPFDSLNVVEVVNGFPRGDRAVDAAFVASMISSFISDGVCPDPEGRFCVTPSDDLSVAVDVGCAWARGYMITSSAPITFSLEPGHTYTIF